MKVLALLACYMRYKKKKKKKKWVNKSSTKKTGSTAKYSEDKVLLVTQEDDLDMAVVAQGEVRPFVVSNQCIPVKKNILSGVQLCLVRAS